MSVPSLSLDFTTPERARASARRLDFTRASAGMADVGNVPANWPRFVEVDADTGETGLLVEEARTNIFKFSEKLATSSTWANFGNTVEFALDDFPPVAGHFWNRIIPRTANAEQGLYQATSQVVACELSVLAKADGYGYLYLGALYTANSIGNGFVFDLNGDGSATLVGSGLAASANIEHLGDGVYLCSVNLENLSNNVLDRWVISANDDASVSLNGSSKMPVFAGDGVSGIKVCAPQLEVGAFRTSYIPTPANFTSRASIAKYFDRDMVLQEAAINVARPHYIYDSVTGKAVGGALLYEAAATNELLHNRDLSNGVWASINGGTYAYDQTGIDGAANSAVTLTDAGAGARGYQQAVTIPDDGNPVLGFAFFKKTQSAASFPSLGLDLTGGTSLIQRTIIDTDTGQAVGRTSLSDGAFTVTDCGEWWLVVNTLTNNSSGNTTATFLVSAAVAQSLSGTIDTALAGSCVIDYPQLELNTTQPTSPIETVASAVTRAADVVASSAVARASELTSLTFDPFAGLTEYTLVVDLIVPPGDTGASPYVYDNSPVGQGQRLSLLVSVATSDFWLYVQNGTSVYSLYPDILAAAGERVKVAVRMTDTAVSVIATGAAMKTANIVAAPNPVGLPSIGKNAGSGAQLGSPIHSVKAYPRAFTDAELIAASTL